MHSKNILPALVVLGMVAATTAFAGEEKLHDHQQTKTHIKSSNNSKQATGQECDKAQEAAGNTENYSADSSSEANVPCEPKTKKEPLHDHRKSKNL